jgi:hypothetical protein
MAPGPRLVSPSIGGRTLGPAGERWKAARIFHDHELDFVDLFVCVFIVVPRRREIVQIERKSHALVCFCEFECSVPPINLRRFSVGF